MKVIIETRRAYYIIYLRFYYNYWMDISAGGLFVLEDIIHPVFSVSALKWLLYIFLCLQFAFLKY
jgi:hypothetical protein